jgi:HlyD family secretion protein
LAARAIAFVTARPVTAGAVLLIAAAALVPWLLSSGKAENQSQPVVRVERGPLVISISESGAVKSREQKILKSEVEGRTTILYLVPEGTGAKAGDLLVELDASNMEEQKTSQQITVMNAEASYIRAQKNLEVTKSQADSDVARAELDCRFAEIDIKKYVEGEYPQQLQKAESDITLAREEQQRAADELAWSQKLAAEGYITRTELQGDELAKKRSDLSLEQSETQLKLLKEYTYNRELERLKSDVEQTGSALERVKQKASADVVQAEADFKARESELTRQKDKLEKMIDQITKCRMTAPVDGMVVYATTVQGDRRGGQQPLAEGQEVRERQELIYLPTAAFMKAEIKVQESSLRKVAVGMPVRITVDALPGKMFYGTVSKIGLLPDAQSQWLNPDLTVYSTEIQLQGDMSALRPGMSCRAEIIVAQYDDALYIPVQAVTRVKGTPTVYVETPSGFEPTPVEAGLDNNRVILIVSGLVEGQMVSLTPPLEAASLGAQGESAGSEMLPDGLVSTASVLAPVTPAFPQEPGAEGQPAAGGIDMEKMRSMSREERQKMFENMTEEERAALRTQFGGRGGSRGQRGDDGSTDSELSGPRFRMDGSTDSELGGRRPRGGADGTGGTGGRRRDSGGGSSTGGGQGD